MKRRASCGAVALLVVAGFHARGGRLPAWLTSWSVLLSLLLAGALLSFALHLVVYADLDRSDSEAFAVEDEALGLLDKAARTAKQASGFADDWIRDARVRADQSPAFAKRVTDTWMGGHIAAQEADARLIAAWIGFDRFEAYTENAAILEKAATIAMKEVDPEAETAKASAARTAAVEQITQAMVVLKSAHRKLNEHWTLTAQAAGANYLMTLFGYQDYLADAIESYRNAVKGREDDRIAQPFADRLSRLEGR